MGQSARSHITVPERRNGLGWRRTWGRQFRFRLIDVRQKRIVEAPEGCNYVALSYVWGQVPGGVYRGRKSDLKADPDRSRSNISRCPGCRRTKDGTGRHANNGILDARVFMGRRSFASYPRRRGRAIGDVAHHGYDLYPPQMSP